jgi:hypothetical protein
MWSAEDTVRTYFTAFEAGDADTVTERGGNGTGTRSYRELFVLWRSADAWRITSYMFNSPAG